MSRLKGGGDYGPDLIIPCIPDATFKTEIDALEAAGTAVDGKLVKFTNSNNYEVTSPDDGDIPNGVIMRHDPSGSSYALAVQFFYYADVNGVVHTPRKIVNLPYAGTMALNKTIVVSSTTYMNVKDGTSGGAGKVLALDTPTTGYVDVAF